MHEGSSKPADNYAAIRMPDNSDRFEEAEILAWLQSRNTARGPATPAP